MELFRALHEAMGDLPIVAEDLGEMFPSVRQLLKESGFPGMKVLQFAFSGQGQRGPAPQLSAQLRGLPWHPRQQHPGRLVCRGGGDGGTPAGHRLLALTEQEGYLRGLLRGVLASPAALAVIPMADWLKRPPKPV